MTNFRFFLGNVVKTVASPAVFKKLRIVAIVACLAVFSGFSANSVLAQETVSYTDASGVTATYASHGVYEECYLTKVTNLPASVTKWVIPEQITFSSGTFPVIEINTGALEDLPFNNMTLTEIEFPKFMARVHFNQTTMIGANCRLANLRKLTFGENLAAANTATYTFAGQPLDTIIFKGDFIVTDPQAAQYGFFATFGDCPATTKIIVPCGKLAVFVNHFEANTGRWQGGRSEGYQSDITWTAANFYEAECLNMLTVLSNDVSLGDAISHSGEMRVGGSIFTSTTPVAPDHTSVAHTGKATLYAIAKAGNVFVKWNDDNTDNPRVVTVADEDVTLTAIFAECEQCEECEKCEECEQCETCEECKECPPCPGVTSAEDLGMTS